ncbi:MAG: hypothetical protein KC933_24665, partial [Myxococcales bacterium]|nr:hypothetical protein [Myxococcales bacterium]
MRKLALVTATLLLAAGCASKQKTDGAAPVDEAPAAAVEEETPDIAAAPPEAAPAEAGEGATA